MSNEVNRLPDPSDEPYFQYPVLDEKKFQMLTVGHPAVMRATSEAFLKYTPLILEELASAISNGERQHVRDIIHKLRSSVSIFATVFLIQQFDDLKRISFTASPLELMQRTILIKKMIHVLYREIIQFVSNVDFSKTKA